MGTCASKNNQGGGGGAARYQQGGGDESSTGAGDFSTTRTFPVAHDAGEPVFCCASVPDDSGLIVTGGEDGRVVVTDWRTGRCAHAWTGHKRSINAVCTGGGGGPGAGSRFVFSCSRDLSIRQWDRDAAESSSAGPPPPPSAKEDGGGGGGAGGGGAGGGAAAAFAAACVREFPRKHELSITALALSDGDGGARLLSGSRDTTVRLWDVATGAACGRGALPRNLVTCARGVPGAPSLFAQGSEDLSLRVWDARAGVLRAAQTFRGYVYFPLAVDCARVGGGGGGGGGGASQYLLTSSKGFDGVGCEARLWDRRRADREVLLMAGHQQDATACAFLPAPGGGGGGGGGALGAGGCPAFAATASKDSTVRVWDLATGNCACTVLERGGMFTALAACHDGGGAGAAAAAADLSCCLFATSFDGGVFVYDWAPAGGGAIEAVAAGGVRG